MARMSSRDISPANSGALADVLLDLATSSSLPSGLDEHAAFAVGPYTSVGVGGPAGPKGDKGEQGPAGLRGATGPKGATGTAGPAGAVGPVGGRGPSGISGWQYLTAGRDIPPNQYKTWQVNCPSGKRALGSGVAQAQGNKTYTRIIESAPVADPAGCWFPSSTTPLPALQPPSSPG